MPDCSLLEHFADLPDPRTGPAKRHPLTNVLVIALCAMLCGAEDFAAMEAFGKATSGWLRERLDLAAGIPSHATFGRVFARLNPEAFTQCFLNWIEAIRAPLRGQVIALDGQTLRRSCDTATGQAALHRASGPPPGKRPSTGQAALHRVRAWAPKSRLVLGQVKVDDKSNAITAIPALLRLLDMQGCIVTCDAMGCQKTIARQVRQQKGDYLLALKDNHPAVCAAVKALFEHAQQQRWEQQPHDRHAQVDKGHSRLETRCGTAVALAQLGDLRQDIPAQWSGLCSLARLTSERRLGPKVSSETRDYLSSLPADARRLRKATPPPIGAA